MFIASPLFHMMLCAFAVSASSVSMLSPIKPNSIEASGTGDSLKSDERSQISGNESVTYLQKRSSTSSVLPLSYSSTSMFPKFDISDVEPLAR